MLRGKKKKVKRFAKQQRSNVGYALACIYCYFLRTELNGDQKLYRSVVDSGGTAVMMTKIKALDSSGTHA